MNPILDFLALLATAWMLAAFGAANTFNVLLITRTWPLLARFLALIVLMLVLAVSYAVMIGFDIPTALNSLLHGQKPHATWASIARTAVIAGWFTGQALLVDAVTDELVERSAPREV